MTDDLVERARTAAEKVYGTQFFNVEIEAAIAVVLEEAVDAVCAVGDHADGGAYINAIRALMKDKSDE